MKYDNLIVLIPSHSLEDFPTEIGENESASLLNAFAVVWHPRLLASANALPMWHRADAPPEFSGDRLVIVPTVCDSWLPGGWADRARSEGAVVVTGLHERAEMLAACLKPLDEPPSTSSPQDDAGSNAETGAAEAVSTGPDSTEPTSTLASEATAAPSPPLDPELVADFLALGTCYLLIELLTRKMHYYSNLDEAQLQREAVAAARAALAGDGTTARTHLKACFEVLTSARERFYPTDCYLIDVCLLMPSVVDAHFDAALKSPIPVNFLVTAKDLEEIARDKPDALARLRDAWQSGACDVIGGEHAESPAPLQSVASVLWDFRRGHRVFRTTCGRTPTTWARRRFGFTPLTPQVLVKSGYKGALHVALDDGIYPDAEQSRIRWEGCDGSLIDAVSRIPLAAEPSTSYSRFPSRMAESMEQDQTAAILFARWPEVQAPWFDDLRRTHAYSPCLGRWVTFERYFESGEAPGRLSKYDAKEYFTPFLIQHVARQDANPITRFRDALIRRHRYDAAEWCDATAAALTGRALPGDVESDLRAATATLGRVSDPSAAAQQTSDPSVSVGRVSAPSASVQPATAPSASTRETSDPSAALSEGRALGPSDITAGRVEDPSYESTDPFERERLIEEAGPDGTPEEIARGEALLAEFAPRAERALADVIAHGAQRQTGALILNPLSFTRRVSVDLPMLTEPPALGGAVKAVQFDGVRKSAVVEVPPCGFLWLGPGGKSAPVKKGDGAAMVEDTILRNDYFEVHFNTATGGIARIKGYGRAPNRLSQQLAFRFPRERTGPDGERTYYSSMRCDAWEVTSNGPAMAEIVTRGELVDPQDGAAVAGFKQAIRVWRARPIVEIEIDLDLKRTPDGDPWTNYVAARFAWNDSTAALTRSFQQGAHSFVGERIESPHYLEIAEDSQRTTILTCGLPFHRKTGPRMLDSLLVVAGETQRKFRFVVAVDAEYPMQAALDTLVPAAVVAANGPPRSGPSGWLFQVDAKNVQIARVMGLDNPAQAAPLWAQHDYPSPPTTGDAPAVGADGIAEDGSTTSGAVATGSATSSTPTPAPTPPATGFAVRLIETEGRRRTTKLRTFRTPKRARQRDLQARTLTDLALEGDAVVIDLSPYEIADVELFF